MIHLAILDVEGVIAGAGGSQYPWPLAEMAELRALLEELALPCVLCTGRQVPYGEAVIQALNLFQPLPETRRRHAATAAGVPLLGWPSILENGGYLYDPLAKRPLPHPALTPEALERLQQIRVEVLLPLMRATGAHLDAGKDHCLSINPPPAAPGSRERLPTAEFRPLVDQALAAFQDWVEVKHSASAIDITPRGVSKASAVRTLLAWTGLPPEAILGVGDTQADAEWLRLPGLAAAPANGRDALPGLDYYSPHESTAGLIDILHWARAGVRIGGLR
jgi:hydroxymethylpyrimidine pyrophosphatase-like HAD family hydrolase